MGFKILLFDIDGTLIVSGGAGRRAINAALAAAFGLEKPCVDVDFAGRTDLWILGEILRCNGLDAGPLNRDLLFDSYHRHLADGLSRSQGRVLPGVRALLGALETRPEFTVGLLTGNTEFAARSKLRHHGLNQYFAFGAWGDASLHREDLARQGYEQALERRTDRPDPAEVLIIGDTPRDVACARAIGATCLAVGTGFADQADLKAAAPEFYLPDLSPLDQVLDIFHHGSATVLK